jgi:hypothetical protein
MDAQRAVDGGANGARRKEIAAELQVRQRVAWTLSHPSLQWRKQDTGEEHGGCVSRMRF